MARYGRQQPTFERVGEYDHTDGPEAADVFAAYGVDFIPAQRHEFDLMLAKREDGFPAATSISISRPRQNGKSFAACYYSAWMCAVEGWNVCYTAHNGGTVTKFFRRLCQLFEDEANADWHALLDHTYKQPGREGIYLNSGAYIEFAVRTNGARGGTYDLLIVDEAQEYTSDQQNAIKPTISATGHPPQTIYIGTPAYPGCHGTIFKRNHQRAHNDIGGGWWLEWAIQKLPKEDAGPELLLEYAYDTNPMLGRLITEEAVLDEIDDMDFDGLCRERLGWWMPDDGGYEHAISADAWNDCATDAPPDPKDGKVAYGVKFAPDGTHAAVAVAVAVEGKPVHVELVSVRSTAHGMGWVPKLLAPMKDDACCYLADGKGVAENMELQLRKAGLPRLFCRTASTRDVIQADARLMDLIRSGGMTHFGQQELTDSAIGASKRVIGNKQNAAYGFGEAPDVDPAPIEAAALAVHAVLTTLRNPRKKQKVVSF